MSRTIRYFLILLAAGLGTAHAEEPKSSPKKPSDQKHLSDIQDGARLLLFEVNRLQEEVIGELSAAKERDIYHRADAVLDELQQFHKALKPGMAREPLYKKYDEMDRKLHELVEAVRALRPKGALQRAVERIEFADQILHYSLSQGDPSEGKGRQVVERQAQALTTAAQQLYQTAQYALAKEVPGRAGLEQDLKKFAAAAEAFRKSVKERYNLPQLQTDFAAVNKAWLEVTRGMRSLPARVNVFLLRSAEKVDAIHERLHRQLGIKGERPTLVIST